MIKEIKYEGYTEVPSDYECPDGDLALAQGAINEDGSLKPILPAVNWAVLPEGYKIVFIHATSQMKHYIIHRPSTGAFYWIDRSTVDDASSHPVTISAASLTQVATYTTTSYDSICAVGNTLMVADANGIHYNLWTTENGTQQYKYLGTHMPELSVEFSLDAGVYWTEEYRQDFDPSIPADEWWVYGGELSDDNQKVVSDEVMGKVNKLYQEKAVDEGKFMYPFLVRYAYRLYDQTLTMHSAPILMVCASSCAPIVGITETHIDGTGALEWMKYRIVSSFFQLKYQVMDYAQMSDLKDWSDIVKSVDIFITAPIYTYDMSGSIKHLKNFTDPTFPYCIAQHEWVYDGVAHSTGYERQTWFRMYRDEVSLFPSSNENYDFVYYIDLPSFSAEQVNRNVRDAHDFYRLASIEVDKLDLQHKAVPIEEGYLQALTGREAMTDDYDSHDTLLPTYMYNYNARLNLAGLTKNLFDGFRLQSMVMKYDPLSNQDPEFDPGAMGNTCVYVYIKEDGKEIIVKNDAGSILSKHPLLMLYYPNPNAYKMVILKGGYFYEYPLTKHDFLSGVYWYDGMYPSSAQTAVVPSVTADKSISMPNQIYTSEVNNPFLFRAEGINTVGIGKVLGMASATKALSEGQFGDFPMYAFTTEGVWALKIQNDGIFVAIQPVTRDVVIDPAVSITSIDTAVLFATERGIMLLQGSNTKCISEDLETENPFNVIAIRNGVAVYPGAAALVNYANVPNDSVNLPIIKEFVKTCRMLYDYKNQRVLAFSPTDKCVLVYSLKTGKWGMMNGTIDYAINSYPEALAMTKDGTTPVLTNFSELDYSSTTKGLLVTRPLKLDYPNDLKTIRNIIQRGKFVKGHVGQVLWGSRDLINWHLVGSSVDHYLHNITGTPYKYFRLGLPVSMTEDENLYGCTVEYELKETNRLR